MDEPCDHPIRRVAHLAICADMMDWGEIILSVVGGGTEEASASEQSTAFRADIGYGIDAVKTILDLKARVEALEGK